MTLCRSLLAASALAALLAGCNSASPQTDLDLLAAFAQGVAPVIKAADPAVANTVDAAVADIVKVDTALSGVVAAGTSQSTLQEIEADVNALAPLAISALPAGSAWAEAAQAADDLLPAIEAAVGAAGAGPAKAHKYSPTQARLVLRGAVVKSGAK